MAYKTPGVYIEEISKFPPSVTEVETAIPAFIGYTEKAVDKNGKDLTNIPTRIKSLVDYELLFGKGFDPLKYTLSINSGNTVTAVTTQKFFLYNSLRSFFDNGGGNCYIVSVGNYKEDITDYDDTGASPKGLKVGLDALVKYDEPTIILFPDAMGNKTDGTLSLNVTKVGALQSLTLSQCEDLKDRVGLFDIQDGYEEGDTPVDNFRDKIGTSNLKYGTVYYPWLLMNYDKTIRLRDVYTGATSKIIDYSVTANTSLDTLKTTYKSQTAITDAVIATLTGATFRDFDSLYDFYLELISNVKAASGTNVKTAFQKIVSLFQETILAFDTIENDTTLGADISTKITNLKADKKLHDQFLAFIGIHKNDTLQTWLNGSVDDSVINALYVAYDSDTGWLAGNTASPSSVANITKDTTLSISPTASASTKAATATKYINANVDVKYLLGALEGLFDIAWHNEEIAEQLLTSQYPFFKNAVLAIKKEMSLLPPSGAIAGVWAATDNTRGVWKAPANVSLNSVLAAAVKITDTDQESLNVHTSGKSVNCIRAFTGKGILVWGARTLAGNDNEWRYINVRRFFNMVEESVKKATEQYVFEPNDANTWIKVRAMIENFLLIQWRQGALAGAKPEQAFYVKVGLGETMTSLDILEGRMNIEIGMAAVRPAEFIILKFSHKMQEA